MNLFRRWRKYITPSGNKWGWHEYQLLVAEIYQSIEDGDFSEIPQGIREEIRRLDGIQFWTDRVITGKSGHKHHFDIVLEFTFIGVRFLVIIECKYYTRKVRVDDLLEFATRLEDIAAHKGILVTPQGYEKGAVAIAESKGIALVVYNYKGIAGIKPYGGATRVWLEGTFEYVSPQKQAANFWNYLIQGTFSALSDVAVDR